MCIARKVISTRLDVCFGAVVKWVSCGGGPGFLFVSHLSDCMAIQNEYRSSKKGCLSYFSPGFLSCFGIQDQNRRTRGLANGEFGNQLLGVLERRNLRGYFAVKMYSSGKNHTPPLPSKAHVFGIAYLPEGKNLGVYDISISRDGYYPCEDKSEFENAVSLMRQKNEKAMGKTGAERSYSHFQIIELSMLRSTRHKKLQRDGGQEVASVRQANRA